MRWSPRGPDVYKRQVVPSPPSAIGTSTHSASGSTDSTPRAIASAAAAALMDSLKESGATTILIGEPFLVAGLSAL